MKRLPDLMFGLVVLFRFLLFLSQRESKFDMGVSLSAVLLGRWVSFLVGWVDSCPCQVATHLSRLRHLGWNQCSHGLSWNLVITGALVQFCGVLGCPKGSAAELLDGSLKLRCCVTPFSNRFPTWSLLPIGNGRIWGLDVATNHLDGEDGNIAKRVRLTRKTPKIAPPFLRRSGR